MALIDTLVSYFKCDEASGDLVDAHGSNTATDTNTVAAGTGKINGSRDFERANGEYFTKSSPTGLDNQNPSVSMWLNTESQGDYFTPLIYTINDAWSNGYGFYFEGGVLKWYVQNYATTPAVTGSLSNGTWYHIVGTYNNTTNLLKMYVNGSEVDSKSRTATITFASAVLEIGRGRNSSLEFDGLMDEIGIWSTTLSAADVTALYNGGAGLAYPLNSGAAFIARPNARQIQAINRASRW